MGILIAFFKCFARTETIFCKSCASKTMPGVRESLTPSEAEETVFEYIVHAPVSVVMARELPAVTMRGSPPV